jgi:hypothetical protein
VVASLANLRQGTPNLEIDSSSPSVCILPQLTGTDCTSTSQAGWCYVAQPGACAGTGIVTSAAGIVPSGAFALVACGQAPPSTSPQGESAAPVGMPCTPSLELSASFAGFNPHEVTLDESDTCGGDVCLVNHFQGLTSCPYGQGSNGNAPPGATAACTVPGTSTPVTPDAPPFGQLVPPQCVDRQASDAVYCSCRCANAEGRTDDGAAYCACGTGYSCTQLVPGFEADDPRAGAYCIKAGTAYDPIWSCQGATCDPTLNNCP